jgi:hypothetical protein
LTLLKKLIISLAPILPVEAHSARDNLKRRETPSSFALQLAAKAQDGGRGDPGGRQLADGHVHHFVTIFNDVVVDHHLKIIETGDSGGRTYSQQTHNS